MTEFNKIFFDDLIAEIEECTEYNLHTKSLIALAKFFDLYTIVESLEYVEGLHEYFGHLTPELMSIRNKLTEKLEAEVEKVTTPAEFKKIKSAF